MDTQRGSGLASALLVRAVPARRAALEPLVGKSPDREAATGSAWAAWVATGSGGTSAVAGLAATAVSAASRSAASGRRRSDIWGWAVRSPGRRRGLTP